MALFNVPQPELSGSPRGLLRLPQRRQTNGYNCGPTCIRIVLDHLEFRSDLSLDELWDIMGTNTKTGTTEIEMERGLRASKLNYLHLSPGSLTNDRVALEYLRSQLDSDQIVFLRTLVYGCKHWVLVHGHVPGREFLVTCPSMGYTTWSSDYLVESWSARDYDHFTTPSQRNLHPDAVADDYMRNLAEWKPVHEMSLDEFTGDFNVVPDAKLADWHRDIIAATGHNVVKNANRIRTGDFTGCHDMDCENASSLRFISLERDGCTHDMVVLDRESGKTIGGIVKGVTWIEPSFRRQGFGAEMVLAAHSMPQIKFLRPSSYSTSGYATRVSAHSLAINRARMAGLEIPLHSLKETSRTVLEKSEPVNVQLNLL